MDANTNLLNSILYELQNVRYGYHVGRSRNLHEENGYNLTFEYWLICTIARPKELLSHGTGCCLDQSAYIISRLHDHCIPWNYIQLYVTITTTYSSDGKCFLAAHFVPIVYCSGCWWVLEHCNPGRNGAFPFKSYRDAVNYIRKCLQEVGIGTVDGFYMECTNASAADLKWFTQGGMTYLKAAERFLKNSSPEAPKWFSDMDAGLKKAKPPLPAM